MGSFPEAITFKVGIYVDWLVKWLMHNFGEVFNSISDAILWILLKIEDLLLWVPWWGILFLIFLLGWRYRKITAGILYAFLVLMIGAFGLWSYMMSTLSVVLTSVVISLLLGVPIGILMTYKEKLEIIIKPTLDAMQTMPGFVYLIPAVLLFGMGMVPAVIATTVYAIPPVIRLTNLGIKNVSKEMVEAAHSFGSSNWQTLYKVQLPQALPTIMTGINQTTMMALSMVVICSMIGARGLGMEVLIAINRIDIARGFESGLSIVILAIIIDRITQGIVNRYKVPQQ